MGYTAKTRPERTDPLSLLESVADERRRLDGLEMLELFTEVTGQKAVVWGGSIIGFGKYDYTYSSGHSGTAAKTGFAVRATGLVVYLCPGFAFLESELARLGPHKHGKGCLYLKNLTGIDKSVLASLIRKSVAEIDRLYPQR